jgi:hypothetical protein
MPTVTATSGDSIARAFLASIGAPDTPLMRKAVIAWIRAESGSTVRAGNPWNITYGAAQEIARKGGPAPIGSWTSQSSGLKFAVYPSAVVGAQASGRLLLGAGHDWRGYDKIIDAAKRNDPIGFLNALARSAWDGGRYGTKNGGPNKLIGIYGSIGGDTSGYLFGTKGDLGDALGAWNDIIKLPEGHIITEADVQSMLAALDKAGYFSGVAGLPARGVTETILRSFIGQPWNKATQDAMQARFSAAATEAGGLGDAVGKLGDVAAAILDPGHWVRFLALLVGGAMVAYGSMVILRASGAPAPSLPSVPMVPAS